MQLGPTCLTWFHDEKHYFSRDNKSRHPIHSFVQWKDIPMTTTQRLVRRLETPNVRYSHARALGPFMEMEKESSWPLCCHTTIARTHVLDTMLELTTWNKMMSANTLLPMVLVSPQYYWNNNNNRQATQSASPSRWLLCDFLSTLRSFIIGLDPAINLVAYRTCNNHVVAIYWILWRKYLFYIGIDLFIWK